MKEGNGGAVSFFFVWGGMSLFIKSKGIFRGSLDVCEFSCIFAIQYNCNEIFILCKQLIS